MKSGPSPVPIGSAKNGIQRILSVDDEPGILLTRHQLLQNAGYTVFSAAGGKEALRFLAADSASIDLVVLDYAMPEIDGGTIAREVKNRIPETPVIMVSASPVPEEVLVGCVDCFLSKGEGPPSLLEKIRQFLVPLSTGQSVERQASIADALSPLKRSDRSPGRGKGQ